MVLLILLVPFDLFDLLVLVVPFDLFGLLDLLGFLVRPKLHQLFRRNRRYHCRYKNRRFYLSHLEVSLNLHTKPNRLGLLFPWHLSVLSHLSVQFVPFVPWLRSHLLGPLALLVLEALVRLVPLDPFHLEHLFHLRNLFHPLVPFVR